MSLPLPPVPNERIVNYVSSNPDIAVSAMRKFRSRANRIRLLYGILEKLESELKDDVKELEEKYVVRLFTVSDNDYPDTVAISKMYKTKSETAKRRLQEIVEIKERIFTDYGKTIRN